MRATNSDLKIAIVGCGPAGLASALILDRFGYEPELFERIDTPKPIGSGIILQPTGLRILDELGLGTQIAAAGQRIDRMIGFSEPSHRLVLDVDYGALGENQFGVAVHRNTLFTVLHNAVKARGLKISTGCEIKDPGLLRNFDLVVDASGARSSLRDHATPPTRVRQLTYGAIWGNFSWPDAPFTSTQLEQRYVGAHTMIGVLPLGSGVDSAAPEAALFWSLPNNQYQAWRDDGLDIWKSQVLHVWPEVSVILDQVESPEQMSMARYAHHTMRQPYSDKMVFIGDAAHATSPQLGQGANMALLDAWALGNALNCCEHPAGALRYYAASRRWHVRGFQVASLMLTPFYQSNSRVLAGLRDFSFDFMSRMPGCRNIVAGLISGLLGDPLGKIGLTKESGVETD